jgi:hypothetical protein
MTALELSEAELRVAGCRNLPPEWWFPEREAGADNHGRLAKTICAACPAREACLGAAVARGESWGIWGAAGEARRRVLRRAMSEGAEAYAAVAAAHWRAVDGCREPDDAQILAGHSGGSHGHRSTYARGCRCGACEQDTSFDGVMAALLRPPRPRRKPRRLAVAA